ncbi:hypothetical protein [Amycolatopsis sp. WGS_07]|uniref:hypothetical protein n=1 Tax=Amycolatopsis sp. WGS_07 TaxID=3076764 RepID=UPI003873C9BE
MGDPVFTPGRRFRPFAAAVCAIATTAAFLTGPGTSDAGAVTVSSSSVKASDGRVFSVTNHRRTTAAGHRRHEYLLAWAGDEASQAGPADPDFVAVIDVTAGTPSYGKVVNTATFSPQSANEPHHMQYLWHKGQRVYAGGLVSDTVFVLDVSRLPELRLTGVALPSDTPCGSAPDAFAVLADGTAYGSFLGGPNTAGPCTYTDGEVRYGNGFAGSPGEIARISPDGAVLAEAPSATATAEDPQVCHNVPALPQPTCANPHGIGVRQDLGTLVSSDFVEVRNIILPANTADPYVTRDTVRTYDIRDPQRPKLKTVSHLPAGPRGDQPPYDEPRGVMEAAVTNEPAHRGAFASTLNGGVYYTPDITAANPVWRLVFDDETAFKTIYPTATPTSTFDAGGWLATSPDDRYLFHTVMFGGVNSPAATAKSGMLYVLDIRRLVEGRHPGCSVDTLAEISAGGAEPDCPAVAGAMPIVDDTSGGPHWGTLDHFAPGRDGWYRETPRISRVATSNYFVAATGFDGNHRVCLANVAPSGAVSPDSSFRDEVTHQPCVDFNRAVWPHGATGAARPHGVLFAIADADLR